jgi:hypothetical protein
VFPTVTIARSVYSCCETLVSKSGRISCSTNERLLSARCAEPTIRDSSPTIAKISLAYAMMSPAQALIRLSRSRPIVSLHMHPAGKSQDFNIALSL